MDPLQPPSHSLRILHETMQMASYIFPIFVLITKNEKTEDIKWMENENNDKDN